MLRIENNIIELTKGDTARLKVNLTLADGNPYTMQTGDTLTITVRKKPSSAILMQVTSSTNEITLTHTNTNSLEVGSCCYDIQLQSTAGDVFTVAGMDSNGAPNMRVLPEVTY